MWAWPSKWLHIYTKCCCTLYFSSLKNLSFIYKWKVKTWCHILLFFFPGLKLHPTNVINGKFTTLKIFWRQSPVFLFFNFVDKKMDAVVQFSRQTLKKIHIFKTISEEILLRHLENSVKSTAHRLVCCHLLFSLSLPCQDNSTGLKTTTVPPNWHSG